MCTAISYNTDEFYFGRNLDYEFSYGESVVVTPRRFPFNGLKDHYAMIGMAHMCDGFPLYYDGFNEKRALHRRAELHRKCRFRQRQGGLCKRRPVRTDTADTRQVRRYKRGAKACKKSQYNRRAVQGRYACGKAALDDSRQKRRGRAGADSRRAAFIRRSGRCADQRADVSGAAGRA